MVGPVGMPDVLKSRRMASYASNGNSPSPAPVANAHRRASSTAGVYRFQVSDASAPSTSVTTER
jgi:hypothetical protein